MSAVNTDSIENSFSDEKMTSENVNDITINEHNPIIRIKGLDNIIIKYSDDTEYNPDETFEDNLKKSDYFYQDENKNDIQFASQFNKIPSADKDNKFCINQLKSRVKQVFYQPAYEGTTLIVYNLNDKWHISTRRCVDAHESNWDPTAPSHYEIAEKFIDFNSLNKNYVYHYNLVSYNNVYMCDYTKQFGDKYIKLIPLLICDKNCKILYEETKKFANVDDYTYDKLIQNYDSIKSEINKTGFNKGIMFTLIYDDNKVFNLNIQPDLYHKIYIEVGKCHSFNSIIPVINIMLLKNEINQEEMKELSNYIKYFNMMHWKIMINIMSVFIKDYYFTRKSSKYSCKELYNDIPTSYKCELYRIHHDIYETDKHNITPQGVYKHILTRPSHEIVRFFIDFPIILSVYRQYCECSQYLFQNITNTLSKYYKYNTLMKLFNEMIYTPIQTIAENLSNEKQFY